MANWIRHHGLHLNENGGMWRSDFSHMLVRRQNGFYPWVELFALLSGHHISDEIRDNVVFQVSLF